MRISDEAIRQVKAATKVVDVLQDFVKLYKRGVNYVALCPFHDDKNYGNFVVLSLLCVWSKRRRSDVLNEA